jgi:hypothetical protein
MNVEQCWIDDRQGEPMQLGETLFQSHFVRYEFPSTQPKPCSEQVTS